MSKRNPVYEVFLDYYESLCHSIPYDDLAVSLVQEKVLTMEETRKVPVSNTERNARESAEYLLETHVHRALNEGDDRNFHRLLLCMKQSEKCAELAAEIEGKVANIDVTDSPQVSHPKQTVELPKEHVEVTQPSNPAG